MLTDIIKKRDELYNEKFKCIQGDCDGHGNIPQLDGNGDVYADQCQFHAEYLFLIKSFRHQDVIEVLEGVIEWARKHRRIRGLQPYLWVLGEQVNEIEKNEEIHRITGYNTALSDLITHLQEQINQIKNI